MRFLKTKIFLAQKALEERQLAQKSLESCKNSTNISHKNKENQDCQSKFYQEGSYFSPSPVGISKACADTKNISINYGRAIVAFAISPLAKPYIEEYLKKQDISLSFSEFSEIFRRLKYKIKSIHSFRSLLLVEEKDGLKLGACKRTFQWISQIFIKYFSVNWIMHGKMLHKMTYLKYRLKMLRRVQRPELFTYVRKVHKNKKN